MSTPRLLAAVEAFLKHFIERFEPTASVIRHIPVAELNELKDAHAEAVSAPAAPASQEPPPPNTEPPAS